MGESVSKSGTVMIVGAGVSGLSCGSFLKSKGLDIQILEASDHLGGRIYENSSLCGEPLEVGASLIHGNNSEFYKMVEKIGGEIVQIRDEGTILCYYEGHFDEVDTLWDEIKDPSFKGIWNLYEDLTEKCEGSYPDISVKEFLRLKNFSSESIYIADGLLGAEYSSDIDKISIKGVFDTNDNWTSGTHDYRVKNMTMTNILKKGFENVVDNIKYDCQIVSIDYSGDKIILIDKKGNNYSCDRCVLSVPITQIPTIEFKPKLSIEKENSFKKIKFGPSGKVFLNFSQQFWPKSTSFILIPGLINVFWPTIKGKNYILTGFVGGQNVIELSKLYKDGKKVFCDIIIETMEKYMKKKIKGYLIDAYWMDWSEAKFIEGGYSYPSVGEKNAREIFREPIKNKVYFAGDSLAENNKGTIHGAMQSGIKAAKDILNNK